MTKANQDRLQKEITLLFPGVPLSAFQFGEGFSLDQAEAYLKKFPATPFIIRQSSIPGHFALDYPNSDGSFSHVRIAPPDETNNAFLVYTPNQVGITQYGEINRFIENYILNAPKKPQEERWQQFKLQQEQRPAKKVAVMSIQTLDSQKITVPVDKLEEFAQNNPQLKISGDGHTGFAMAMALHAPFAVVRSEGNREDTNKILKDHLADKGLLILTGHGSPQGNEITGNYGASSAEQRLFKQQTQRGPQDITNSALEAGLKSGDNITILLSICYGASDQGNEGNSFAHKLAREFAQHGISTTIIASDKPVGRFGSEVIEGNKITFNKKIGMAAEDVCVFTTEVSSPNSNPHIEIYRPNESIQLSERGLKFIDPNQPVLQSQPPRVTHSSHFIVRSALQSATDSVKSKSSEQSVFMTRSTTETPLKDAPDIAQSPPPVFIIRKAITTEEQKISPRVVKSPLSEEPVSDAIKTEPQNESNKVQDNPPIVTVSPLSFTDRTNLIRSFRTHPELSDLFDKIKKMENYGKTLTSSRVEKGRGVTSLAQKLDHKLIEFLLTSTVTPPTPEAIHEFKRSFKQLLDNQGKQLSEQGELSEHTDLSKHREIWKPIAANILIALSGIGLLAIIMKVSAHIIDASINNKPISFNKALFFAETKSQSLSEDVDKSFDSTSLDVNPKL